MKSKKRKMIYKYLKNKILFLITRVPKRQEKYRAAKNWLKAHKKFCRVFTPNTFFVIGDSHTDIFNQNMFYEKVLLGQDELKSNLWGCIYSAPDFVTYHLDAVLAYNMNRHGSTMKGLEKIEYLINNGYLPKHAKVVTSLGEIDCRVHVKKQAEQQNITTDQVIYNIIQNYGTLLKMLKNKGYRVYAYAPIASQKETVDIDPQFPRYGSEIERNNISLVFGKKLKEFCDKNNMGFVSMLKDLLNDDMTTKGEYYRDGVHLNMDARPMLVQKFKDL
ncbi:MAG: hypothetical protein IKP35_04810 [Alphaproteobacteria bacterium]|nr:hypothetical protein [Alphaproteobacteria bacterium]